MIKYIYLLLLLVTPVKAQETIIVPVEEYTSTMYPDKKIGIVDKLGNIEWRNPLPKPAPIYDIKITKAPKINTYKKGVSKTGYLEFQGDLYGYLNGVSVGAGYKSNQLGLGIQLKFNNYSSPEGYEETHLIGKINLAYHLRPHWYVSSPSHPRFDPALYLTLGYDKADVNDIGFVYGVGLWVGHQLFKTNVQGYISMESLQQGGDGLSNTFSLGIRYSFK